MTTYIQYGVTIGRQTVVCASQVLASVFTVFSLVYATRLGFCLGFFFFIFFLVAPVDAKVV
jgi:hypothetical protein